MSLKKTWEEPVARRIVLLMALFVVTITLILVETHIGEAYAAASDRRTASQRAKRLLGDVIQKQLLKMELDMRLIGAEPRRSAGTTVTAASPKERAIARIRTAENVLFVLSHGGTFTSVMPANFYDTDEFVEEIHYYKTDKEELVVEALELVPKLADLENKAQELDRLAIRLAATTDPDARARMQESLDFQRMSLDTVLLRSREVANKIYHDADQELVAIEQNAAAIAKRLKLAEYITAVVLGGISLVVAAIMLKQVAKILDERHSLLEKTREHGLQLDRLVKERTADLKRLTEQNELILDAAGEGIFGLDCEGRTTFVNPTAAQMLGYTPHELMHTVHHETVHCKRADGSDYPESECPIHAVLTDGVSRRSDNEVFWRKNGTCLEISYCCTALLRDGEVAGAVVTYQDITERRRTERELLKAKEEAQAANLSKSEFLANMSHEIRTPMTAILGFAEVVLEAGDLENAPPERLDAAKTIKRNGEYLLGIINDILDLSKVEAGKIIAQRIPCNLFKIVADISELIRIKADGQGISFDIECENPIPEKISTDPTRMRQILINLLGNAVKFTEVGGVQLIMRFIDDDREPMMQFDIRDTGIGMSDEQLAGLFQPFAQVDSSSTRRFGGTGLGLSISKRLAAVLGGDIFVVESEIDVGTCFRFTLATGPVDETRWSKEPLSLATAASATPRRTDKSEPGLTDCRVLLAEDGPDNQRLISFLLTREGAIPTVKENGKLAVEAVLDENGDLPAVSNFDVILMDMQMPVMDGYEATALLREKGFSGPIIALTAHAMTGNREKCLAAGCDDFATKPIQRQKLVEIIRSNMQAKIDNSDSPRPADPQALSS